MYIVDEFGVPSVNLNRGDTYADVSHGELVGLTYETLSGRPYTAIDVPSGYAGGDYDNAILNLAAQVRADHPDGDLGNVAVNLSFHSEPLGPRASDALNELMSDGATVYVASGNNPAWGPNPLSEIPGVVTVGGNTGRVGEANSGVAIAEFPFNAETDVFANAVIVATPVADADGEFAGVDINQDGQVDIAAERFANDSGVKAGRAETLARYTGQPVQGNELSYQQMEAHYQRVRSHPDGEGVDAADGKVIRLSELIDNDGLDGLKPPPGSDPDNVFISIDDAGGSPEYVTFFEADHAGMLQPLSNIGDGVVERGTSYAAPGAAASDVVRGARSSDLN